MAVEYVGRHSKEEGKLNRGSKGRHNASDVCAGARLNGVVRKLGGPETVCARWEERKRFMNGACSQWQSGSAALVGAGLLVV